MSQIDSIVDFNNRELFLEKPSKLPELDGWVEDRIKSQRRFTFSERDVLQSFWNEGEDIRLREDSRFCEITFIQSNTRSTVAIGETDTHKSVSL